MSKNLEKMPLCSTDDGVGQAGLETQSPTCAGTVDPTAQFRRYHIQNMCCPVEERLIRNRLEGMHGVIRLEINLLNRVLGVHYDLASDESISKALSSIGMQAEPLPLNVAVRGAAPHGAAHRNNAHKLLLSLSGVTAVTAETLAWTGQSDASALVIALALASIVSGGLPTLRKGWIALRHLTLNIHFLMSLAVVGAVAIGQWPEAAMVIFLFAVAEAIEAKSLDRARNAVHSLLQIVPDTAFVQSENGSWETMRADQVRIGALIRVRPGERIPLDGVVEAGESAVDQAPITGESIPAEKHKGDAVFAGTINDAGTLDIRVTVASDDSTLAHIVRVLEETQGRQAPTQRFIDTFARYYTPAVVLAALGVAIVPPLAFGVPAAAWLYKALVMLVIACPCALVISTPVTVVSGLTAAARRGILIKGGEFLEAGHRIRVIALDKTGTLTRGEPVVTEVAPLAGMRPADVLLLAASLNVHSAHPLARAIAAGAPAGRMLRQVRAFASLPGRGIRGDIGGKTHYLGNVRLLDDQGGGLTENNGANTRSMLARMEEEGHTAVALFTETEVLGVIAMTDELRPEARLAVKALAAQGVKTVMLTGDNARTSHATAEAAGVAEVRAQLLPEHKLDEIRRLQSEYGVVGMVGDGINDAPALARAEIGFAMGVAGSDTAIETADVALMDDDLRKLPQFIDLSRRARHILLQNIFAALVIKIVFFGMAIGGIATLWMAVFADVGASLFVVANGLRLLNYTPRGSFAEA